MHAVTECSMGKTMNAHFFMEGRMWATARPRDRKRAPFHLSSKVSVVVVSVGLCVVVFVVVQAPLAIRPAP